MYVIIHMKKNCRYGVIFFLLDLFLDLFESKWLFEYKIRQNNKYILRLFESCFKFHIETLAREGKHLRLVQTRAVKRKLYLLYFTYKVK